MLCRRSTRNGALLYCLTAYRIGQNTAQQVNNFCAMGWSRLYRLGIYGLELMKSSKKDNSLRESVTLGKRRTEMMIRYGIIPGDKTKD